MVSALICSGQLSLPAWEPYVSSRAAKRRVWNDGGRDFFGQLSHGFDFASRAIVRKGIGCI